MTITYDKDGAYIETVEDGVSFRRSIRWEDCVVSVPGVGNEKIDLAYINSSDHLVLVLEDESEITIIGVTSETNHGELAGLTDDDHTIYLLANGTRAASEIRLTPKASSSGPEGTMFYASVDNHVYVGTE